MHHTHYLRCASQSHQVEMTGNYLTENKTEAQRIQKIFQGHTARKW
jgi:hypothetical protein